MPLVFVDISTPTAAIVIGAMKLGNQKEKELFYDKVIDIQRSILYIIN